MKQFFEIVKLKKLFQYAVFLLTPLNALKK